MEYKWADFLTGGFASPLIRINNATDLKTLQKLVKQNKLFYYESFLKLSYRKILKILEINSKNYFNFYKHTNKGKSFLVEYQVAKGFICALLNEYDEIRENESEWKVFTMSEIIKELNL